MSDKPNASSGKQAKWALGIMATIMAVVVMVVLAMTSGLKGGQEKLDDRLRIIEKQSAADSAKIEAISQDVRDIKRWVRPTGGAT